MLKKELEVELHYSERRLSKLQEHYDELAGKYKRLERRNCYLKHLETKLEMFQKELESLSKLRRELT